MTSLTTRTTGNHLQMSGEGFIKPATDVVFQELQGEMVLANLESGDYFALNSVGASIWRSLLSNRNLDDAIAEMLDEYEVDEATLRADVLTLVTRLK